jgi:hypothetical protein
VLVVKEEFVGGDKWSRAVKLGGSDAIVMWLALKCYASRHPSNEGFVPDESLDNLPGAPRKPRKALAALVDCGLLGPDGTRGAGLVELVEGGFQLHDYLDHSQTPEEIELRREKARDKKRRYREQQRRELAELRERSLVAQIPILASVLGDSRGTAGDSPPATSLTCARPHVPAHAPAHAHGGVRTQPNPTQPNPLFSSLGDERERDDDREPETPHQSERRWKHFPKGWREWSSETMDAATRHGLTAADLGGHVDYWTLRNFPGGSVNDLDGELMRSIRGIAERKRAASSSAHDAPGASNPYAWAPTQEHREFAKRHGLTLQLAVDAYRASGLPEKLGTLRAHDDFTRRLKHWHVSGEFVATGPLKRAQGAA